MDSSLSTVAYRQIRRRLLRTALPAGRKVSEHRLARELKMSRTPVREAIRRLETEGVLRQVASSGTFVAMPDRQQLIDVAEVRMALESFAVRRAVERIRPAQMAELQASCDRMRAAARAFRRSGAAILDGAPLRDYLAADLAFHLLLLRVAGNRHATKLVTDAQVRSAMFGYRSHQRDLRHVARMWLYHARIARAVRRRDARRARLWLERHLQESLDAALESFDARRADGIPDAAPPPELSEALEALIAANEPQAPRRAPNRRKETAR
jgi:DNA-binding GntR family transcriptional regulator